MSEPNSRQAEVFRFGDCVLDTAARELHRNGAAAAIEPRAFDLLVYLIRNRKRTIAKDELLDVLWAGSVVSETSLTRCVMKARKAVGDSAGDGSHQHYAAPRLPVRRGRGSRGTATRRRSRAARRHYSRPRTSCGTVGGGIAVYGSR